MNKIQIFKIVKYVTFACSIVILQPGCELKSDNIAEGNKPDYETPVTKPFKMPASKPINWKVYPQDSVPVAQTFSFNLDKLPSKPFSANEFKKLPNPIKEVSFDWNKLEKLDINLDTIKGIDIKVKKFLLPSPTVSMANIPGIWSQGTSAIVKLSEDEGLPDNNVIAITQDPQGIVWIATEKGIARYDGSEFLNYNFFEKTATGAIERIPELLFDKQGRLLVSGLDSGIYRIDLKTRVVELFMIKKNAPYRMTIDANGRLWGAKNLLRFYDLDLKKEFTVNLEPQDATPSRVFGVKADKEGNLWIGLEGKVGILNASQKSIHFIGKAEGLKTNFVFDFTPDAHGNMWFSSRDNSAYVSIKNKKVGSLGPEQGYNGGAVDVFSDKKERIWLISNDTVTIYDPKLSRIKKMVTASKVFTNFPTSGMKGNDGLIWMGTSNDGVLMLDPEGLLSDHFTVKDGLESTDFWGVQEDSKGRMLFSSYNGLHIYNPATQRVSVLNFPAKIGAIRNNNISKVGKDVFLIFGSSGFGIIDFPKGMMTFYDTAKGHITSGTFSGLKTADDKIWLSGEQGIIEFDPVNKTVKKLAKNNGLAGDLAFIIKQDNKGRLWVITDEGVNVIDPKANTIQLLNKSNGLNSDYASMFFQASNGDILIGSDKGISIFNNDLTSITQVAAINGLIPESMFDMNELNNRIQIGSENGIIVMERPLKGGDQWHFYNYNVNAGFPANDYNQATSFVSSTGITFWGAAPYIMANHQDPITDTLQSKVYIKSMNIMDQDLPFTKNSDVAQSLRKEDTILVGTKPYTKNNFPINAGYYAENKITWDGNSPGFNMPIGLKLPHNQNSFNFSYVNESQRGRDKIVYRYFLEGADDNWSESSSKTISRIYYNLSPGDYTFNVISRGFNGIWSKPDQLKFTILSPWWQTWWAYLIYLVLFLGIVSAIVRVRSQWLKNENKLLEEKVNSRTAELNHSLENLKATQSQLVQSEKMASLGELTAGIAHEIQNPLNFVNNFSEVNKELLAEMKEELEKGNLEDVKAIANDVIGNEEKINYHGKRADAIVKGMLQHSRSSSGVKELTHLNALCDEYLRLSYHGLRAKDKSFNATLKTDFDTSIGKVNVIPQDFGRVVLNLLNNAFYAVNDKRLLSINPNSHQDKHYEPTVTISTKRENAQIIISVNDNGNGMPQETIDKVFQPFFTTKPTGKGTGLGLSMSYDIITKGHNGELKVASKENEGTTFNIILPI